MNREANLDPRPKALAFTLIAVSLLTPNGAVLKGDEETALPRQRMMVLTDIEADPDDTQSLVRLLLYANSMDIEAIVATTSVRSSEPSQSATVVLGSRIHD